MIYDEKITLYHVAIEKAFKIDDRTKHLSKLTDVEYERISMWNQVNSFKKAVVFTCTDDFESKMFVEIFLKRHPNVNAFDVYHLNISFSSDMKVCHLIIHALNTKRLISCILSSL